MKFKVGDKVKIRSDLEVDNWYGKCYFNEDMVDLKGKEVTIKEVQFDLYDIEEDEMGYWWTDEMIEGKVEDMKKIKGWELLKEIAEDNLKEGTKLKDEFGNIIYFDGYNLRKEDVEGRFFCETLDDFAFSTREFEIIEQEEMNIQDIEEIEKISNDIIGISLTMEKINELIKAIKQLDRKMKGE